MCVRVHVCACVCLCVGLCTNIKVDHWVFTHQKPLLYYNLVKESLMLHGHVWECMGMYGHACMGMYGNVWECMGMYGHVWACIG